MTASAFVDDGRGPSLDNVLTVLKAHGISVESHQIDVSFILFSVHYDKLYVMVMLCYIDGAFC